MMTPFDREEVLDLLRRRVGGFLSGYRKNLALLGPEGEGKTVLLQRLLQEELPPRSPVIPLYLEVREGDSPSEWALRFTQSLLYAILQARKVSPLPRELAELSRACAHHAPRACGAAARILRMAEQGRSEEAYGLLWDLPSLAASEIGCPAVLVLDEFHRLRGFPVRDPFRPLGRRIMVQGNTLYLVASSQPQAARAILREGLALLFGQFETLEMGPLPPLACLRAIRDAWPGILEDPFLEEILLEMAQGHAATLDLLLAGLRKQEASRSQTAEQTLLDLLQALFLGGSDLRGRFEMRLRSLPAHPTRLLCVQVLCAVAGGKRRLPEIAQQVDRPASQAARALRLLERAALVKRQGAFHKIPERLFELWMRMGHPLLHGVGLAAPAEASAHFQEMARGWITEARGASGRPMEQRVAELLRQWRGEVVEVDGRRTLLPEFSQVELAPGPSGKPSLVARRSGRDRSGWRLVVWDGALTEPHARELAESLRAAGRDSRKVAVGPYPIDINARLILQQAKVRLWDLQTLNGLLDLYALAPVPVPRDFDVALAQEISLPLGQEAARRPEASSERAG
ncbi:MAG: hypothetical protein HYZ95_01535 [Candidatus Omnitrophica bacterium]|nr:hypothetical protein [Candidatus Omnitrophota bacterium]